MLPLLEDAEGWLRLSCLAAVLEREVCSKRSARMRLGQKNVRGWVGGGGGVWRKWLTRC
jgi:hypothetical protein